MLSAWGGVATAVEIPLFLDVKAVVGCRNSAESSTLDAHFTADPALFDELAEACSVNRL